MFITDVGRLAISGTTIWVKILALFAFAAARSNAMRTARVAGFPLLVRGGSGEWRPRPSESIERALVGIYGVAIDPAPKMSGLGVVAEALNRGDGARAQIATLLLKLPDPGEVDSGSKPGLRKLAVPFESGWIAKDWDPSKHPRTGSPPNPGWFAPNDGDPADDSKPTPPAGTETAEIKPIANPAAASDARNDVVPVAGREEDERFPWEERDDEGGTYFNPETGQMMTLQPGSGVVLREPWIRLDDLPTQTYLSPSVMETWANPSTFDDHYVQHADEFGATSPEDYAEQANEFYQEAQRRGCRVKVDVDGTERIYDLKTNTFGSYTADGKTITFFKPDSGTYFERQPGTLKKCVELMASLDAE